MLCGLANGASNPSPWINIAQNEYLEANETVPWFLQTSRYTNIQNERKFSNNRSTVAEERMKEKFLFQSELEKNPTYNAFEKDIAIANIYFSKKRIMKYVKENKMSSFDFLSQIGGSIGLAMGISIISLVEFIYWFTIRLFRTMWV